MIFYTLLSIQPTLICISKPQVNPHFSFRDAALKKRGLTQPSISLNKESKSDWLVNDGENQNPTWHPLPITKLNSWRKQSHQAPRRRKRLKIYYKNLFMTNTCLPSVIIVQKKRRGSEHPYSCEFEEQKAKRRGEGVSNPNLSSFSSMLFSLSVEPRKPEHQRHLGSDLRYIQVFAYIMLYNLFPWA